MAGSDRRGDGRRLDRPGAARIVRRATCWAGITNPVARARCGTRSSLPSGSARPVHVRSRLCLPGEHGGDVFHAHAMEVQMEAAGQFTCGFAGVGRVGAAPAGAAKRLAPPS